eukprot:470550-Hanusia_phi.AAC.2
MIGASQSPSSSSSQSSGFLAATQISATHDNLGEIKGNKSNGKNRRKERNATTDKQAQKHGSKQTPFTFRVRHPQRLVVHPSTRLLRVGVLDILRQSLIPIWSRTSQPLLSSTPRPSHPQASSPWGRPSLAHPPSQRA